MQYQIGMAFEPAHEKPAERVGDRAADIQPARVGMGQQARDIGEGLARAAHPPTMGTLTDARLGARQTPCQRIEKIQLGRPGSHSEGTGILSNAARISAGTSVSRRGS